MKYDIETDSISAKNENNNYETMNLLTSYQLYISKDGFDPSRFESFIEAVKSK